VIRDSNLNYENPCEILIVAALAVAVVGAVALKKGKSSGDNSATLDHKGAAAAAEAGPVPPPVPNWASRAWWTWAPANASRAK